MDARRQVYMDDTDDEYNRTADSSLVSGEGSLSLETDSPLGTKSVCTTCSPGDSNGNSPGESPDQKSHESLDNRELDKT